MNYKKVKSNLIISTQRCKIKLLNIRKILRKNKENMIHTHKNTEYDFSFLTKYLIIDSPKMLKKI